MAKNRQLLQKHWGFQRLGWFQQELGRYGLGAQDKPRAIQQLRRPHALSLQRATEEKVLWGNLADLFHLICTFSLPDDPIRKTLAKHHFDAIYLDNRKTDFISPEFRSLMFEIWKVKYLQMPRFREVIDVWSTS